MRPIKFSGRPGPRRFHPAFRRHIRAGAIIWLPSPAVPRITSTAVFITMGGDTDFGVTGQSYGEFVNASGATLGELFAINPLREKCQLVTCIRPVYLLRSIRSTHVTGVSLIETYAQRNETPCWGYCIPVCNVSALG